MLGKYVKILTTMPEELFVIEAFQRECASHWNEQSNEVDSYFLKDNYLFY
jgi:hypothetical protein